MTIQEVTDMAKRYNNMNIRKLENDYVRATDSHIQYVKKRRSGLKKRLIAFFLFASVVIISLISTIFTQNTRLVEKEEEKEKALTQLEEVLRQQEQLNLQITKLEDDEYIAKLARKEYFMSEDGEIIFTIPSEDKQRKNEK